MNTVRLSPELKAKILLVAQLQGISQSEVQRRALEAYCEQTLEPPKKSRFDRIIGIADGAADASSRTRESMNQYLEQKHG
jgi:predicted transcriptional regulator